MGVRTANPGADRVLDRLRFGWREAERIWLLPVSEPLDARIASSGWKPVALEKCCDRCGQPVGAGEKIDDEMGCASCRGVALPWDRFVHLGLYVGELAEWVQEVKFTRNHWLGRQLGAELGRAIARSRALGAEGVAAAQGKGARAPAVAPIASPYWRRVLRGIDHAGAIAAGAAAELGLELVRPLHKSHRRTQRGLSPTAREENMRGAFRLRRPIDWNGRTVIVIDDVCTTGATMRAACRAIRAGRKRGSEGGPGMIVAAALALTPGHARRGEVPAGASEGPRGVDSGV